MWSKAIALSAGVLLWLSPTTQAADTPGDGEPLRLMDIFELEYASDPQISPDGQRVVYVRRAMDVKTDRVRSSLWTVQIDGSDHRPLGDGSQDDFLPRWSPDGRRLAFLRRNADATALMCRWLDTGDVAKLTDLTSDPGEVAWSPDGRLIAYSMFVDETVKPFVEMPAPPEGAQWGPPPRVIQSLRYRHDGDGYLKNGFQHLFLISSEGGAPRQITEGPFHHNGYFSWTPDGKTLLFSANRHPDGEYTPLNTEIYQVDIDSGRVQALTDRTGPDDHPVTAPDGRYVAYLGFDDRYQGYQVTRLYVMNRDGSGKRTLAEALDRDIQDPVWSRDARGLFFLYDDQGNTKVGFVSLEGKWETRAADVGGTTIGRPYASGSFTVASGGEIAFTHTRPDHAAEVAVKGRDSTVKVLTSLSGSLLRHRALGTTETLEYTSSLDGRRIQGWIVKPPGFDPSRKYPLILEIHGGPFANYGERFSMEIQLYAAAGYVVLYTNPRGSTGYGEAFGNLIHHQYPGHDYQDLMSGVDAVLAQGYVDENNLFVTGGSGGGVLTAWIVGKTGRFRAAVAAKPVVNWYSFALTADEYPFFYRYWFPGFPWEQAEHYLRRSPIALVGQVTTPTMLLTGEEDYRTPISESEQFYQALKLRKVPTALVRIPGVSHDIVRRPSGLIAKVAHILKWFEMYRR